MTWIIILVVVAVAVAWRVDSFNDELVTKGREPLDLANPFHWLRGLAALLGFGIGYTPHAIKHGKELVKNSKLKAEQEWEKSGLERSATLATNKAIGSKVGKANHEKPTNRLREENAKLAAELRAAALQGK